MALWALTTVDLTAYGWTMDIRSRLGIRPQNLKWSARLQVQFAWSEMPGIHQAVMISFDLGKCLLRWRYQ